MHKVRDYIDLNLIQFRSTLNESSYIATTTIDRVAVLRVI